MKNRLVHHLISTKMCTTKVYIGTELLCAAWCTEQVGDAQCRSIVHNVALYHWSGAHGRFHKPMSNRRDGQMLPIALSPCFAVDQKLLCCTLEQRVLVLATKSSWHQNTVSKPRLTSHYSEGEFAKFDEGVSFDKHQAPPAASELDLN